MSAEMRLPVVLCWHMHQPHYHDRLAEKYVLPWTYLHAIKDYVDMAALLESVSGARAVVNFVPTLLEQLDDYSRRIKLYLTAGEAMNDPLLASLVAEQFPSDPAARRWLIEACLRLNRAQLVDRYPRFRLLVQWADEALKASESLAYLSDSYLADLVTWYHLAWLAETVRRDNRLVMNLIEREGGFTLADRRALLALLGDLIGGVIPRYRALAAQGRVELSVTPYAHPIAPLMLDLSSAREAMPETSLPVSASYPGGEARLQWHIDEGLRVFENHFGFRPRGCWPAEGGVSSAALDHLGRAGFAWTASGGAVLHNSLIASQHGSDQCIHRPYQFGDKQPACFFRDDGLSDLIGFTYSKWNPEDAVSNLIHHLENIANACGNARGRVASIIMDGENAWEYYPENGYPFLMRLYERLASHPRLRLTTYSEFLEQQPPLRRLSRLVAGSWVYGTFSTWIGDADKNLAWDLLCDAKRTFDSRIATLHGVKRREAEHQLAICEGSDWFWWFGDYNPSGTVRDFDNLYRGQLRVLYQLLNVDPPARLSQPISLGGGDPATGGVMRPGREGGGV
jgi:alpha-amylase/alpha-mannosidase (GH57 family)